MQKGYSLKLGICALHSCDITMVFHAQYLLSTGLFIKEIQSS